MEYSKEIQHKSACTCPGSDCSQCYG